MRKLNAEFIKAMEIERSFQPMADKLYQELFPGCEIETIGWDESDRNKKLQMADVDRIIHTKDGKSIKISEKFRTGKYKLTDVMIELYSNLESKKLGWAFQSEADYLFYYKGGQVCIVDAEDVKQIAQDIFDSLSEFDFDSVELNKITKQSITIDKVEAHGNILVSKPAGQTWATVNYVLPIETMKKLTTKMRVRNL